MAAIKVMLADDDTQAIHYYRKILDNAADIDLVADTMVSQEVVAMVATTQPDVVLIDYAMYPIDGFRLLDDLQADAPDIAVILLGGRDTLAQAALNAGAAAYLSIPITPRALLDAIRAIAQDTNTSG